MLIQDKNFYRKFNKKVRDSVFTDLFKQKKYLLQLYNVLHPEEKHINEYDLSIVTINNVLVRDLYNDLGFIAKDRAIILVECQSTWSENIALRSLFYIAETLRRYVADTNQSVYKIRKINIPKPELYLIYTGDFKPDSNILSFNDIYFDGEKSFIDLEVRIVEPLRKNDIVAQYTDFSRIFSLQYEMHKDVSVAIKETIRICKEYGVLAEYFEGREKEIVDMYSALYDERNILEEYIRMEKYESRNEGINEGRIEGINEGRIEGINEGRIEGINEGINRFVSRLRKMDIEYNEIIRFVAEDYNLDHAEAVRKVDACLREDAEECSENLPLLSR